MRHTPGKLIWTRGRLACAVAVIALTLGASSRVATVSAEAAPALPERLSDADFWKLVTDISEPGGYFQIVDNFTSNEGEIGVLSTELRLRKVSGDVYIGVGPEQNLSYIAAIRPKMAFIIDIRRQAVMQHLMFKAMFELAKDRSEFISLLFGRKVNKTYDAATSIHAIWSEYIYAAHDSAFQMETHRRVTDRLLKTRGFKFTPEETAQFNSVFEAFQTYGPDISTRSGSGGRGGGGNNQTFRMLTSTSTDRDGQPQSFLSTEENFQYVKALHEKNLIVPVSGDFGGPKALRAIGAYVKERGGVVRAYYVSNVEQYLFRDGKGRTFYENVAALPVDSLSVFIRPYSMRRGAAGPMQSLCPIAAFVRAALADRVLSNNDALACVMN
jgi:hypothetical protein